MSRLRRIAAALLLAAALAPGLWWRARPPAVDAPVVRFHPLAAPAKVGPFAVEGAWRMTSPHFWFGSYSALAALGDGTLLAGSDRGWTLRFAPPGAPARAPRFAPFDPARKRRLIDLEALVHDPASRTLWGAFEYRNAIARVGPGAAFTVVHPPAMRRWPLNGGAEAMARLADGRFVVLGEAAAGGRSPGLLFAGDPTRGAAAQAFAFAADEGYRPVDLAALPDGRVLVLLRRVEWRLPPGFAGRLAIADPRAIREGAVWRAQALADLAPPLPTDNFEGLAVAPGEGGALTIWLISDDNRMAIQRTLLIRLRWIP